MRVICVDNLLSGSLANIEHIGDDAFQFIDHDVSEPFFIDEPLDFVYHFAALASPEDYLRMPLATPQGRLVRNASHARPREVQARPLPHSVDERGVRRPADPPAAGDATGGT